MFSLYFFYYDHVLEPWLLVTTNKHHTSN